MKKILETLQELEDQKQSILDVEDFEFFQRARMVLASHELDSNEKYLLIQRIDESVIQNLAGFLLFEVPLTLFLYFILRRLFFCLF